MIKLLEIIRSAARLVRGYVAHASGSKKSRLNTFGKATGTELFSSTVFPLDCSAARRAPKIGNLDAMMVSTWAKEAKPTYYMSGRTIFIRQPFGLSKQEAAHAHKGGLVVCKGLFLTSSNWSVVFPTTEDDFPDLWRLPGSGRLFGFRLTEEDESQAIEAELRRRAMAAVIKTACPDTEISEPSVTAPRRRRIGV